MIPFVPHSSSEVYILAAARKAHKWACRGSFSPEGAERPLQPSSRLVRKPAKFHAIIACDKHSDECPCVRFYRTERRKRRKVRRRRTGAARKLREVWKQIPDQMKVKRLSKKQCVKHNVSYDCVSRGTQKTSFLENLRIMILRLLIQMRRVDPKYRVWYDGYFLIPRDKWQLYRMARCLCRDIIRTVSPMAGQWVFPKRRPLPRKDPWEYKSGNTPDFGEEFSDSGEGSPGEYSEGYSSEEFASEFLKTYGP